MQVGFFIRGQGAIKDSTHHIMERAKERDILTDFMVPVRDEEKMPEKKIIYEAIKTNLMKHSRRKDDCYE